MGSQQFGVDPEACYRIASQVQRLCRLGVQVGIVIGGGNIFRGAHAAKLCMERTSADHIGMLATIINGISLQQAFGLRIQLQQTCGVITLHQTQSVTLRQVSAQFFQQQVTSQTLWFLAMTLSFS